MAEMLRIIGRSTGVRDDGSMMDNGLTLAEMLREAVSNSVARAAQGDPVIHIGSVASEVMPAEDVVSDHKPVSPAHLAAVAVSFEHGAAPLGVLIGSSSSAAGSRYTTAPHRIAWACGPVEPTFGLPTRVPSADAGSDVFDVEPAPMNGAGNRFRLDVLGSLRTANERSTDLRLLCVGVLSPLVSVPNHTEVTGPAIRCATRPIQQRSARGHVLRSAAVGARERRHKSPLRCEFYQFSRLSTPGKG